MPQTAGARSLEQLAPRLAALAVAAPLVWCGIGVVVASLLHRRMAGFAARYATVHALHWPPQRDAHGDARLFLHMTQGQREVFFSDPESWRDGVVEVSFLLVPTLLTVLGAQPAQRVRQRGMCAAGTLPGRRPTLPVAGRLWMLERLASRLVP